MRTTWALCVACLIARPASAQLDQVVTLPPNFVLGNYDNVPVGPFGGLEGSAYVARVGDPSAAWFNPAGLARETTAQLSGSAGVYQLTSITPEALPNRGGSDQQLPNFVGFAFAPRPQFTLGAALLTTNAWTQETDAQLISPVVTGQQRFSYSADSTYERRILALGAGYQADRAWRFGGGLAFSLMNVRLVQTVSDRIADVSGLSSLLVNSRVSGSALQVRSQAGFQYDRSYWRVGAAVRTPGLTFYRSGAVTHDGLIDAGAGSLGASLFDPDADLDHKLPWEFQWGAAWAHDRLELELDLQMYSSIDAYSMLTTAQPIIVYLDSGGNQLPATATQPFAGLTSASDGVVNVSAGGHVRLFESRDVRFHAGIGSNRSPVADADMIFNKVDLVTWALGVSGSLGRLQFAAGFNRQSGAAHDVTLRNLLNGQVVRSSMDVRMTGFIYSLAYQF